MKFLKTIIYLALITALIIGGYFGWKFYVRAKAPAIDALYILPQNAVAIISFNNYQAFNQKVNSDNQIWQNIRNTYGLESTKSEMDSIINDIRNNSPFKILLDNPKTKFYISYLFAGYNKFETIYSLSLSNTIDENEVESYLSGIYKVESIEFEDKTIFIINQKGGKEKYYLSMISGVISLSHSQASAEKIILSAQAYKPENKRLEQIMLKMAGKDMDANIYLNYNYLYRLISFYANNKLKKEIKELRHFSQRAVLDVLLQKEQLILSGFSIQNDSIKSFLSTYKGSEPKEIKVAEILPYNTSFMYFQGGDNLSQLLENRSKGSLSERNEKRMQQFKARYLVDASDYFYPWIKYELVSALSKTRSSELNEGAYAIIESTDIKEANQALSKLATLIADIKGLKIDTTKTIYRSHELYQIPYANLLPMLFGNFFSDLKNTYYTYIDNYVIFANSNYALQKIIDNYIIERTLSNNNTYIKTLESLSTEANILLYSNLHYMQSSIENYLSKEGIALINHSDLAFSNFGAVAVEFIANDEGTYSTFVLQNGGKQEVIEPISWRTALDNPIASGPYWIKNHKTNHQEIVAFDKENLMYRFDENGGIAWAIPVLEPAMSQVFMIDYYHNGKYQYMFNTKHYLHLYDLNGNKVENYPIKLPQEASAPMTLIDYDNNKNYRILIPMTDGKVYNFKIDGTQTPGWKFPEMKSPIHQAVQFFKLGTKDFLVICDTSGNVIYANRRGESRMDAKLSFTNNTNTIFYKKEKSNPKTIITTDLIGRIIEINAAGKVNKLLLREFSKDHVFLYFDFNGDNRKDYIFIDNNTLFVFNHRNELILKKEFEHRISRQIKGVKMKTQESIRLVLHDLDEQKILFITVSGDVINNNEYACDGNFIISENTENPKSLRINTAFERIISSFLIN